MEVSEPGQVVKSVEKMMEKSFEATKKEFKNLRTGRASTVLVEGITVDYYNTPTPLKGLANITTPDAKTIAIQAWDATALPEIEKAILKSDLGLTPNNDGKIIRITVPALTDERREELTRLVRKIAEEGRIGVRNARHEALDVVKKFEKDKEIPEDESKNLQKEIQKVTDKYVAFVDDALKKKEEEIHTV